MPFFPTVFLAIAQPGTRAFMLRLYETHHRAMYIQAYRVTREWGALDDIVQEACVKLMAKTDILTQLECHALKAYVVLTVRNTAINYVKARARRRAHVADVPDEALDRAEAPGAVDGQMIRQSDIDSVRRAIERLPEKAKEILDLKYRQNLPDGEIAKILGIKQASVRQAVSRAREKLKAILLEGGAFDA